MPIHIEEMSSEITVFDGDFPLSERQTEKLVKMVLERLDEKKREDRQRQDATALKHRSTPPLAIR